MKTITELLIAAAVSVALVTGIAHSAFAADSCTDWLLQTDGSYFRTCVDDKGTQYCQSYKDNVISKVSCS